MLMIAPAMSASIEDIFFMGASRGRTDQPSHASSVRSSGKTLADGHSRPKFAAVGWLASGANPNVFAPPLGGAFFADQGFDEHGWADRVRKLNEEKRKDNPVVAAGL
jgi:hypothetical protein